MADPGITKALASSGALGGGNTFAQASFSPTQTRNNINQPTQPTNNGRNNLFAGSNDNVFYGQVSGNQAPSENLRRLERLTEAQSRYQTGYQTRQERYNQFVSGVSFGGGTPYYQRSFLGRRAEDIVSIGTGFVPFADTSFVAAQKTFLNVGGFLTPEARSRTIQESRRAFSEGTVQRAKDPDTYFQAIIPAGAIGYSSMRGSSVPRSVRVSSQRGAVTESSVSQNAITGFSVSRSPGVAQYQYGPFGLFRRSQPVVVESNVIFSGQRIPGSNQFGVRAEGVSSVTTRAGLRFATNDFAGVYNANTNVLSLGTPGFGRNVPGSQGFVSQGGRTTPAFFDTVSTVESAPGRYITLETGRGGFARVTGAGRTGQLLEQQDIARVSVRANSDFSVIGPEARFSRIDSQSLVRGQSTGGANSDLFAGGFQNLERQGLYRTPRVEQRAPITDRVAQEAGAFFENRRGNVRVSRGSQEFVIEQPRVLPSETVLRNPGSFELTGLPIGQFPSYAASRFPAFIPGTGSRYSSAIQQSQTQRGSQRIINRPLTDTTPLPITDTLPRQTVIPTQTTFTPFRNSGNPRTPPPSSFTPPPVPPPNTPPLYPVVPFIPLVPTFGRGTSFSAERSFSAASFKYVPSLTAGYLNIRGKKPRSLLNPIEVRPIVANTGRKR